MTRASTRAGADFGGRVLASLEHDLARRNNSPGDGQRPRDARRGPGRGLRGAVMRAQPPTAGIVSLDVMDDQGMARASDVITAAPVDFQEPIASVHNIRVANFSLHSATPTSFRWDPLDKAVEKLWFAGVVVVAASGNQAQGGERTPMAYAPANDPFVITVGALDLHNSTNPDRADLGAPWSAWGYTLDGFAKPELSAPGARDRRPCAGRLDAGRRKRRRSSTPPERHVHEAFRHVAVGADRLGHRGRPCWRFRPSSPDKSRAR